MTNPPQNPFQEPPKSGAKGDRGIPVWIIVLCLVPLLSIPFLKKTQFKSEPTGGENKAPELTFKDRNGRKRMLSEFKGQTVLLNFWASWCGPCMDEMPELVELDNQLGPDKFGVVAVNVEEDPRAAFSVPETGLPKLSFYEVLDTQVEAYNVGQIPISYLIDAKGLIRRAYLGPRRWTSAEMLYEIRKVIDAYPTESAQSPSPTTNGTANGAH